MINNSTACDLVAWVAPGHGFVQFACDSFQESVGFFPNFFNKKMVLSENQGPLLAKSGFQSSNLSSKLMGFEKKGLRCTYAGLASKLLFNVEGLVLSDAPALDECLEGKHPCLYAKIPTTPEKASLAWDYVQQIKSASENQSLTVDDPLYKEAQYNLWSNNCIDFVFNVMSRLQVKQWNKSALFTQEPSLRERIRNLAWHYFKFR